jgi:hypothetical protein
MSDEKPFTENLITSQNRRRCEIEDIEAFVIDRCDAKADLKLTSLQRLNDRDLAWLAQAVANS